MLIDNYFVIQLSMNSSSMDIYIYRRITQKHLISTNFNIQYDTQTHTHYSKN